jgi:hypothetical protein
MSQRLAARPFLCRDSLKTLFTCPLLSCLLFRIRNNHNHHHHRHLVRSLYYMQKTNSEHFDYPCPSREVVHNEDLVRP